jgi:hypothetical protein
VAARASLHAAKRFKQHNTSARGSNKHLRPQRF